MPQKPIWKSIAETLTADLAAGHYSPGDKLPTEAQLAARFDVNRHTVRHALAQMAEGGLVYARRGAGVFVAETPTDYPLGKRVRFHQNLAAAGREGEKRILSITTRAADSDEATALKLDQGALVHVCEGLLFADHKPIGLYRSVYPAARLPDLPHFLNADTSVTRALAQCGVHDYTRTSTRLTAKTAKAVQARHLNIAEGAPVLRSVGISVDPQNIPVEFGSTWFAGDRVTLTLGDE